MRRIRWLACGLFLVALGVPLILHAQTPAPAPANPGIAHLFEKHTDFGLACMTCHDEAPAAKAVPTTVCLSCHGSNDDLADLTDGKGSSNPHASHNGPLDCDKCHNVHKPSVNFCQECHAMNMDVP